MSSAISSDCWATICLASAVRLSATANLVLLFEGAIDTLMSMADAQPARFKCPNCEALYQIVRVEAAPANDRGISCLACGGALPGREGQFILKYFLFASFRPWSPMNICRYVNVPSDNVMQLSWRLTRLRY